MDLPVLGTWYRYWYLIPVPGTVPARESLGSILGYILDDVDGPNEIAAIAALDDDQRVPAAIVILLDDDTSSSVYNFVSPTRGYRFTRL